MSPALPGRCRSARETRWLSRPARVAPLPPASCRHLLIPREAQQRRSPQACCPIHAPARESRRARLAGVRQREITTKPKGLHRATMWTMLSVRRLRSSGMKARTCCARQPRRAACARGAHDEAGRIRVGDAVGSRDLFGTRPGRLHAGRDQCVGRRVPSRGRHRPGRDPHQGARRRKGPGEFLERAEGRPAEAGGRDVDGGHSAARARSALLHRGRRRRRVRRSGQPGLLRRRQARQCRGGSRARCRLLRDQGRAARTGARGVVRLEADRGLAACAGLPAARL